MKLINISEDHGIIKHQLVYDDKHSLLVIHNGQEGADKALNMLKAADDLYIAAKLTLERIRRLPEFVNLTTLLTDALNKTLTPAEQCRTVSYKGDSL